MKFFPHNLPLTSVATAVSASFTKTGSFIANFSAIAVTRVDTASIALNLTGSAGAAGTSYGPIVGPKGAQGNRGVTGPRGDSVYLLSSSWHDATNPGATCPSTTLPTNCWPIGLYAASNVFEEYYCDFSVNPPYNPTTYYTTSGSSQEQADFHFGIGWPLYTNNVCSQPVTEILPAGTTLGARLSGYVYTVDTYSSASITAQCYNPSF